MCSRGGKRSWMKHPIFLENNQYHDMIWADLNGNGRLDIIAPGKCGLNVYRDLGWLVSPSPLMEGRSRFGTTSSAPVCVLRIFASTRFLSRIPQLQQ